MLASSHLQHAKASLWEACGCKASAAGLLRQLNQMAGGLLMPPAASGAVLDENLVTRKLSTISMAFASSFKSQGFN